MRRVATGLAFLLLAAACGSAAPQPVLRAGPVPRGDWFDVSEARFAPSGERVAVIGAGPDHLPVVGVLEADGPRAVTTSDLRAHDVAWAGPDHLLVHYSVADEGDRAYRSGMRILTLDGDTSRDFEPTPPLSITDIAVTADGTRAVVAGTLAAAPLETLSDLFEIDLRTGAVTALTATPDRHEAHATFLPSGALAYSSRPRRSDDPGVVAASYAPEVVVQQLGGRPRVVSAPGRRADEPVGPVAGEALLYADIGPLGDFVQRPVIWAAPLGGGEPWPVFDHEVGPPDSISADGRFVSVSDGGGTRIVALPPGWDRPPAERSVTPAERSGAPVIPRTSPGPTGGP